LILQSSAQFGLSAAPSHPFEVTRLDEQVEDLYVDLCVAAADRAETTFRPA